MRTQPNFGLRTFISTIAATPHRRLRATADRASAYGGAFQVDYTQDDVLADRRASKAMFGAVMTDEIGEYVATHEVDTLPEPALVD